MVSIYDANSREFAFNVDELHTLQCEKKMKFRNAWSRQIRKFLIKIYYLFKISKNIKVILKYIKNNKY